MECPASLNLFFYLQQEIKNAELKFEELRVKSRVDFANPSTIKNASEVNLKQMKNLLKQKEEMQKSLELMEQQYDGQLHEMYPNWDGRKYLTIEKKEFFVMAKEYFGKNITPEDFPNPPRKYSKEEQIEIIFALYCISSSNDTNSNTKE